MLRSAPVPSAYGAALTAALAQPGNILSDAPDLRWARLVGTCCAVAGGTWERAVPVAAAVELFMVALDVLDDEEDGEQSVLRVALGAGRALNVSTGLLLLAQQGLLDAADGPTVAALLIHAGLEACGGQDADLAPPSDRCGSLDDALAVTASKAAPLVAVACRLGAVCAGANPEVQELYARFGGYAGMVAQLANDLAAIRPEAAGKTDIALGRPTLPLTHASLLTRAMGTGNDGRGAATHTAPWAHGPVQLTWAVAEMYRRRALDLIPQLASDHAGRTALAEMLSVL